MVGLGEDTVARANSRACPGLTREKGLPSLGNVAIKIAVASAGGLEDNEDITLERVGPRSELHQVFD